MKNRILVGLVAAGLLGWCCGREAEAEPREPTMRENAFKILTKMPRSRWDVEEDANDREARLDFASILMTTAARNEEEVAALLTLWWFESRGALYVWRGCRPEEIPAGAPNCSGGNARSPWQLEECACPEGWEMPRGSDGALWEFAGCAARHWRAALEACGDPRGAFARYAQGHGCEHVQADERSAYYGKVLRELKR